MLLPACKNVYMDVLRVLLSLQCIYRPARLQTIVKYGQVSIVSVALNYGVEAKAALLEAAIKSLSRSSARWFLERLYLLNCSCAEFGGQTKYSYRFWANVLV